MRFGGKKKLRVGPKAHYVMQSLFWLVKQHFWFQVTYFSFLTPIFEVLLFYKRFDFFIFQNLFIRFVIRSVIPVIRDPIRDPARNLIQSDRHLEFNSLLRRRANARNVSSIILYGGRFTFSTQLLTFNYPLYSPTDAVPQFLQKLTPFILGYTISSIGLIPASWEF